MRVEFAIDILVETDRLSAHEAGQRIGSEFIHVGLASCEGWARGGRIHRAEPRAVSLSW
jgi:hypothetical protein